jgi:hypothetical protein
VDVISLADRSWPVLRRLIGVHTQIYRRRADSSATVSPARRRCCCSTMSAPRTGPRAPRRWSTSRTDGMTSFDRLADAVPGSRFARTTARRHRRSFRGCLGAWRTHSQPRHGLTSYVTPARTPASRVAAATARRGAKSAEYRKAYYRSFFLTPPACAVAGTPRRYRGEATLPYVLLNVHRYFFYLATIVLGFLCYDAVLWQARADDDAVRRRRMDDRRALPRRRCDGGRRDRRGGGVRRHHGSDRSSAGAT